MMHTLLGYLGGFGNFALFLVALGFIVFVHELGHFLTAKWAGVRVTQFAIGFGHAVCSWRKGLGFRIGSSEPELEKRVRKHLTAAGKDPDSEEPLTNEEICKAADELGVSETEYRFNWIPLGGYVKMLGQEDLDPTKVSQDRRSFNKAPIWKRMIIISAGVTMNIIFAIIFFMAAFMWGVQFPPAVVGEVAPGSPAATAVATNVKGVVGLLPGDRLLAINGKPPTDFTELQIASALTRTNEKLTLRVERPPFGERKSQILEFSIVPTFSKQMKLMQIGVERPLELTVQIEDDPALRERIAAQWESVGVQVKQGWILKQVNGQPVDAEWQYELLVRQSGGKPMDLLFIDPNANDAEHHVTITPVSQFPTTPVVTVASSDGEPEHVTNLLGMVPAVRVGEIGTETPASGVLQTGDVIVKAGEYDWPTIGQVQDSVLRASPSVSLEVLRDGKRIPLSVTPRKTGWVFGKKLLGIQLIDGGGQPMIGRVLDDSPLSGVKGELTPGSTITAVNGQPVKDWGELHKAIDAAGDELKLTVNQPVLGGIEHEVAVKVTDAIHQQMNAMVWLNPLGVFKEAKELQQAESPTQAVRMGFDKTWLFLKQTYVTLLRLADRSLSPSQLSGPVGIASIGTKMADRGLSYLMYFAGLISVNLAVINFLPLPIVDGGLFVMLLIEKARGKPLPVGVQSAIAYTGLVLLGAVFLFVTFNDIVRMVGG